MKLRLEYDNWDYGTVGEKVSIDRFKCRVGDVFSIRIYNEGCHITTIWKYKRRNKIMKTLEIPVKFQSGDEVYTIKQIKEKVTCQVCEGAGKIEYNNKKMRCPECMGAKELTSNKTIHTVCDEPFVISSIKINLNGDRVNSIRYKGYCGFSPLNRAEENIFSTKEEAQKKCDDLNRKRIFIDIENIVISDDFKNTTPSVEKIAKKLEYYRTHKRFEKDIIINKDNVLMDGYINYLLCKILNINTIKVIIE